MVRLPLAAAAFLLTVAVGTAQEKPGEFKRRSNLTDEELRRQLFLVPDVGLNQAAAGALYAPLRSAKAAKASAVPPDYGPQFYLRTAARLKQTNVTALPWRSGLDCQIGRESAETIHVLSRGLRLILRQATPPGDVRPDPEKLRPLLTQGSLPNPRGFVTRTTINPSEWKRPEAVPTLTQMLQAENTPVRQLLVELLSNIPGKDAAKALAQRAVFDLSPAVRKEAVAALAKRPAAEYKGHLLDGLRSPWPPAADHAAEAVANIGLPDFAPALAKIAHDPDPSLPYTEEGKSAHYVREMVRVNHLSNCMVCHAPSFAKDDLVRGRVPTPGEDPPPEYYQDSTGLFVRADITFLRQDFSVVQPVASPGKWPGNQRFDYFLRTRKATPAEMNLLTTRREEKGPELYPQREAVKFALREIATSSPAALKLYETLRAPDKTGDR